MLFNTPPLPAALRPTSPTASLWGGGDFLFNPMPKARLFWVDSGGPATITRTSTAALRTSTTDGCPPTASLWGGGDFLFNPMPKARLFLGRLRVTSNDYAYEYRGAANEYERLLYPPCWEGRKRAPRVSGEGFVVGLAAPIRPLLFLGPGLGPAAALEPSNRGRKIV